MPCNTAAISAAGQLILQPDHTEATAAVVRAKSQLHLFPWGKHRGRWEGVRLFCRQKSFLAHCQAMSMLLVGGLHLRQLSIPPTCCNAFWQAERHGPLASFQGSAPPPQ